MEFRLLPWVSWSFFAKQQSSGSLKFIFLTLDCCFAKVSIKPGSQSKIHELNIYI